MKKVNQI